MKVYVLLKREIDGDKIQSIFKNEKDVDDMLESLNSVYYIVEEHELIE